MRQIFVTGVSSGLGVGLCQAFLEEGDAVFGCSRRPAHESIRTQPNFKHASIDLADLDGISGGVTALLEGVRHLDLLFLNAGVLGEIRDLVETDLSDIREVMDANVWANKVLIDTLHGASISVKHCIAISSGASVNGHRGWNAYSLSKATLNMLIKLYAEEMPETIFHSLAPGLIDTAMQDYMSTVPDAKQFPSVQRLRDARGTDAMPHPYEAGKRILACLPELIKHPSGSFADIRKL